MKRTIVNIITPDIISKQAISVLSIYPAEVAAGDYDRFDTSVVALNSAGKAAAGFMVIGFAYDADPRELYEIPEVVAYIRGLFARCPHLLYYMPAEVEAIRTPYLCLIGVIVTSKRGGAVQLGIPDMDAAQAISARIVNDACAYARGLGDDATARKITAAVAAIGVYRK